MVQIENGVRVPEAIYFDTNVLFQLPNWELIPDFVKLIDLAEKFHVPCYMPEIVLKEFIYKKSRNALEYSENIERTVNSLSKLLVDDAMDIDLPKNIEKQIEKKSN